MIHTQGSSSSSQGTDSAAKSPLTCCTRPKGEEIAAGGLGRIGVLSPFFDCFSAESENRRKLNLPLCTMTSFILFGRKRRSMTSIVYTFSPVFDRKIQYQKFTVGGLTINISLNQPHGPKKEPFWTFFDPFVVIVRQKGSLAPPQIFEFFYTRVAAKVISTLDNCKTLKRC